MNNNPPEAERDLIKENRVLQRRVERMTKEMKNLVALNDRAMKLRDYSEREKKLQYEYNFLLLDNAPDMIFIMDQEMRFRLGTKSFLRFLGLSDAGTINDAPFEEFFKSVMPPEWIESTRERFETVARERCQEQYNDEVLLDGEKKVFSITAAPATSSDGKVMGVICLMHDSTELFEMKEAAEAATRTKSSFLASMSHEIRTPMNAIKGLSELMARTPLSRQQKIYIDNIVNATSSLLMIINDILDFSKIEANRYEIAKVSYETAPELDELCAMMQPKASDKGIYFATDIDPRLPSALVGDNLRIHQILVNIINNAIKFTSEGGIVLSMQGEPMPEGEWLVTYTVKDTGQGIKQEELPKIFQAFEQANFYKNRNITGTGLGLAISKNLAELMGGDITVSSEYGAGSEFVIRLPQAAASDRPLASVAAPEDKNLLVFFPNRDIADLAVRSAERLGVRCTSVTDVDGLGDAINAQNPTHIIIDDDLELAVSTADQRPGKRVACLRSITELGSEMPRNVRMLFKPLTVVALAAFINGGEGERKSDRPETDALGSARYPDAHVLVVDDNEINLIVASEMLRTYDIEPDTADGGEEALEMVGATDYDIVFMDHMMPGMDGIEATAAIRAMDIRQPVIVALTANAILGMEDVYKRSGFDAYITKPIEVKSLNDVLATFLGKPAR